MPRLSLAAILTACACISTLACQDALAQTATYLNTGQTAAKIWSNPAQWSWSPGGAGFPNSADVDVIVPTRSALALDGIYSVRNIELTALLETSFAGVSLTGTGAAASGLNVYGNFTVSAALATSSNLNSIARFTATGVTVRGLGSGSVYRKTGDGLATFTDSALEGFDLIRVENGNLSLVRSSVDISNVSVSAGAALLLSGARTFTNPTFKGEGSYQLTRSSTFAQSTIQLSGTVTATDLLFGSYSYSASSGSPTYLSGSFDLGRGSYTLQGGFFQNGTVTFTPESVVNIVAMSADATSTIINNTAVTVFGGVEPSSSGEHQYSSLGNATFINNGSLRLLDGGFYVRTLLNPATGVITKAGQSSFTLEGLTNNGTLNVERGTLTLVNLRSGTPALGGSPGTPASTIQVAAGATLIIAGATLNDITLDSPGTTALSGTSTLTGFLRGRNFSLDGTIQGDVSLINTKVTLTSGNFAGNFRVAPESQLIIAPTSVGSLFSPVVQFNGRLLNQGTLQFTNGISTGSVPAPTTDAYLGGFTPSAAGIVNESLAEFTTNTSLRFTRNTSFTNTATGTISKFGTGLLTFSDSSKLVNLGRINVLVGTLEITDNTNFGQISVATGGTAQFVRMTFGQGTQFDGGGTFRLGATNTFAGTTIVNAAVQNLSGDFILADATLTGSGSLALSGRLTGRGRIDLPTTLINGQISPGTAAAPRAILQLAGVTATINSPSTFTFDLANPTPGTGYDQIQLTAGTLQLASATLTLNLDSLIRRNVAVGSAFILIDLPAGAAPAAGTFASLPEGTVFSRQNLVTFQITYLGGANGNDVVLTVTNVIPEPTTAALAPALCLPLARRRRR